MFRYVYYYNPHKPYIQTIYNNSHSEIGSLHLNVYASIK